MIDVKICGIRDRAALDAAIAGGARHVGLMFFPRSPRFVEPADAAALTSAADGRIERVGVFVNPNDDHLWRILDIVTLDVLQLHGRETPDRVADVRRRFGLPVWKAASIADAGDVERARAYEDIADAVLFDAKPPKDHTNALPGGNAIAFDWRLVRDLEWRGRWILSGGLTPENVGAALRLTGAPAVDVSSGVENVPGEKDPALIRAFLAACEQSATAG